MGRRQEGKSMGLCYLLPSLRETLRIYFRHCPALLPAVLFASLVSAIALSKLVWLRVSSVASADFAPVEWLEFNVPPAFMALATYDPTRRRAKSDFGRLERRQGIVSNTSAGPVL